MKEAAVKGGAWQKVTGVRELHTVATERSINQEPTATTSARGMTQGVLKGSRQANDNTLPTGYVRPGAVKVKSLVSNHGDFLNNHGDFLGESAIPGRPSPMTCSQTATRQIPLYNDGCSRVRGLAEGRAIQKAKYARECGGKNTLKWGFYQQRIPQSGY